ncbi:MAG: helix-turn-helix domain-containing protein [Saprospiraceae bacterium]|nr:helix-turn-helix domain-containing protein [Saprospiraceae bacterium]
MNRLQVQRICQHCGSEFTAQKTVTKYCSLACGQKAYKLRTRNERIDRSNSEIFAVKMQPIETLKTKEFLKVKEAALLLNCSVRSLYYYVGAGNIKAANLGQRITRIKRSDIDHLFQAFKSEPAEISQTTKVYSIQDCYSLSEIKNRFSISDKALHEVIKRNKIPKIKHGWYTYVPKSLIEDVFVGK